jgi:hypothetical protein
LQDFPTLYPHHGQSGTHSRPCRSSPTA